MLIAARKQPVLERLYAGYGRRLLRGTFARVRVGGSAWPEGGAPVIAYANHGAWWDPVLAVFLSHDVFRRDGYGLMDGAQLTRYPFFRRVGCFGVTGEGLAIDDARAVAEYTTGLLRGGRDRVLWLFPQGELFPNRAALRFRSGLARISQSVPEARLVAVAIRYEFREAARPECVVRVGEASTAAEYGARSTAGLTRRLERELGDAVAALDADLVSGADLSDVGYRPVLTGAATVSRVYDRTVGRLVRRPA